MTLERALQSNPYDPNRGNLSAYIRYLRDEKEISMEFVKDLKNLFTEVDGFSLTTLTCGGVMANVNKLFAVKMNLCEE